MTAPRSLLRTLDEQTRRLEQSYGGILLPIVTAVLIAALLCCTIVLSVVADHPQPMSDPAGSSEGPSNRLEADVDSLQAYLDLAMAEMTMGHNKAALRALESYERLKAGDRPAVLPTPGE